MRALGYHCRSEMMRTAGDIRDDLGFLRVRHGRLENADDGRGSTSQADRASNDIGITIEATLPQVVADHDDERRVGLLVRFHQRAPEQGWNAQGSRPE